MTKAQDAAIDAAALALLRALPLERLDAVLEQLGIPLERREAGRKADLRRCTECGHGYVRCRQLDAKALPEDQHEWSSDR